MDFVAFRQLFVPGSLLEERKLTLRGNPGEESLFPLLGLLSFIALLQSLVRIQSVKPSHTAQKLPHL